MSDSLLVLVRGSTDYRLVFKYYPLTTIREEAFGVAVGGACAAEAGRFWEFHDRAYEAQRALGAFGVTRVVAIAVRLGIDSVKFERCLTSTSARGRVDEDRTIGARLVIFDTPTFFVNGKRLQTADWSFLRAALEWERRASMARPGRRGSVSISGGG